MDNNNLPYIYDNAKCLRKTAIRRRLRGWSDERATLVVTMPRFKIGQRRLTFFSVHGLLHVLEMTCIDYVDHQPLFKCTCACGNTFQCKGSDLFYDVNCGCIPTGHVVGKLPLIKDMEADMEFRAYCVEHNMPTTLRYWLCYKAAKCCFTPRQDNDTRCVGHKYKDCETCWKYGAHLPPCFRLTSDTFDDVCADYGCSKRAECVYYTQPSCFSPEKDEVYPLCVGRGLEKCKECAIWNKYEEEW